MNEHGSLPNPGCHKEWCVLVDCGMVAGMPAGPDPGIAFADFCGARGVIEPGNGRGILPLHFS